MKQFPLIHETRSKSVKPTTVNNSFVGRRKKASFLRLKLSPYNEGVCCYPTPAPRGALIFSPGGLLYIICLNEQELVDS